ncbi:RHS repeat-associated core domain-containing protein [Lentisphaerota bacterium WC36G]|nr:RHS repeat-associated core domain-containing protein [Lentisphaerae bacterium WC36]
MITTKRYSFYQVDGNKNIVGLVDESAAQVNTYEYSPFGKLTTESETVENPFKFSSEYADSETNLVYYNYRYYNTNTGKWLKRDPIEEQGGLNLYGFVENNPINYVDLKGLKANKKGCCGKNITRQLRLLSIALERAIKKNKLICNMYQYSDPEWGWDIAELYKVGTGDNDFSIIDDSKNTDDCKMTVQVGKKCYKAYAVNYFMWGRINKLCGKWRITTTLPVDLYTTYKKYKEGDHLEKSETRAAGKKLWTVLGYYNIFSIDGLPDRVRQPYVTAYDDFGREWKVYNPENPVNWDRMACKDCILSNKKYDGILTAYIRKDNESSYKITSKINGGYSVGPSNGPRFENR